MKRKSTGSTAPRITPRIARQLPVAVASAVVVGATVLGGTPAWADVPSNGPTQTVSWTEIGIYPRTGPTFDSSKVGAAVADGTRVTTFCEESGQPVTSNVSVNNPVWAYTSIGWIPSAFLDTGYAGFTPNVPICSAAGATSDGPSAASGPWTAAQVASTPSYDRAAAAQWARDNYSTFVTTFDGNGCTEFLSHLLWNAGWERTKDWTDNTSWGHHAASGWQPWGYTKEAVSADHFKNWIVDSGYATIRELDASGKSGWGVTDAQVGDIIQYDFHTQEVGPNGGYVNGTDGVVDHTVVIVGFNGDIPLIGGVDADVIDSPWFNAAGDAPLYERQDGLARAYLIHVTR